MTAAKKPAFITDKKEFDALVASITKRGAKLDADIQLAGLSALNQLALHGNVYFVNRLYTGLHAGARKSAMTAWLLQFGAVIANTEGNKKEMPFVYSKDKTTNVAEATLNPWFDFKPDQEPDQVFDIMAALAAVIKKAQGKNVDAKHLLRVENLLSDLKQDVDTEADVETLVP